jgi:Family of unknown function (DUF5906)
VDFFQVTERRANGGIEVLASFTIGRVSDLMIRGGAFYAVWDEERERWSTDELDVQRIVDRALYERADELKTRGASVTVRALGRSVTNAWKQWRAYCTSMFDTFIPLDSNLTFANTKVRKEDHASKTLPYSLAPGPANAYDRLMSVLYRPAERRKLEWALGSIFAGDSKDIQKFIVLYGEGGTGKSTFLHIAEQLFEGYWVVFDGKLLVGNQNSFASAMFRGNPLVAISHDSDLSQIVDNTLLNSVVAHEAIIVNEKYRTPYSARINSFLFIGTNQSVRITDAKSGLIRRLIDVNPTGDTVPSSEYDVLVHQISFELGAIAAHCLEVYRRMGKNYYSGYRPQDMMIRTDIFFNFMRANYDMLSERDGITLKEAWNLYKDYCQEAGFERKMNMHRFRDEMKNYFGEFHEMKRIGDTVFRSLFREFRIEKLNFFLNPEPEISSVVMEHTVSLIDDLLAGCPAQYASEEGIPGRKWSGVKTKLRDLETSRTHFVKPPPNHIVIDFDLKGPTGEKSLELNLAAASKFPPTYAEQSQSGSGIHLHYMWNGDTARLSRVYDNGIEIKVFTGDASLRRRLTRCSNVPVATISEGLPLKEQKVIDSDSIKSERGLRRLILRNLFKEIHPGTKPSIDFIYKILEDAHASGMAYDVTDMRPRILAFANNSTNNPVYCIKKVMEMKFASEEGPKIPREESPDERLVIFDVEVFPNLCVVGWKYRGSPNTVRMINPKPGEIEKLSSMKLVGFNNRRFDNHILYAIMMGYSNLDLFKLSQRIIKGEKTSFFGDAYNLSYADIWDFSSVKQGLKRWQIELGLIHKELGLPWDQPVDESQWEMVADYCVNDVVTTEQVFESRQQDFVARQILAKLSGLTVNDTTQRHTARIIFGDDRHPQEKFVYTDLSVQFPGYSYDSGVSTYKGETTGEGGYVYAEPGMYSNVGVLDITSMHPASIVLLDLFGPYTKNFAALRDARIAIKHHDYDSAKRMFGGSLAQFLGSDDDAAALAYALKIIINIVYGLTSASFDNPFRDIRNVDNIVAKRGALFMIDLKQAVQDRGYKVIHIKTDSIKIPDADPYIIEFVTKFGQDYGYEFEHEVTYEKFCLVNEAVYIAKRATGEWTAIGAQFSHPYVFKTLFSREEIKFDDLCETKTVTAALYLDFGDGEPHFVGRAGSFCPVTSGSGGGTLLRGKDGVFHAVTGTKGYFWKEAAVVKALGLENEIDYGYFRKLADAAVDTISKFGDYEWLVT